MTEYFEMHPDSIIENAVAQSGASGFEEGSFREGLNLLCRLMPKSGAAPQGLITINRMMVDALACRFATEKYLAGHPSLSERGIEKPLFVCGLPRTGTTMAVNLLSQDQARRAPIKWELSDPMPPAAKGALFSDPRCMSKLNVQRQRVAAGELKTNIHFEWANEPTECVFIHAQDFRGMSYEAMLPMPEYLDFILNSNQESGYLWHKRFLQALQAFNGGRWLLKAPSHALFARDLIKVYPDARLVWTHRNPITATASMASLLTGVEQRFRPAADHAWIAESAPRQLAEHANRMIALSAEQPSRIYNLDYRAMMTEPIATMKALYAWLGDDFTPQIEHAMVEWVKSHPMGKHGGHQYSLEDFGINKTYVLKLFESYIQQFQHYWE